MYTFYSLIQNIYVIIEQNENGWLLFKSAAILKRINGWTLSTNLTFIF